MNSSPLISIIMPCFQQVAFLEEAVRSVLDQQGVNVELLVMDPGSTDGSRELLQRLKKEYGDRLVLNLVADRGQSDAINRGMTTSRGNILGWLNSDDRLHPDALRKIVPYLDTHEPRWLYGYCGIIDEQGKPIFQGIAWYKNMRGRRFSIYKLLTEPFIAQPATFWNRSIYDKVGEVEVDLHLVMDYDLFLRFASVIQPTVLKTYLADFRHHRHAKTRVRMFEAIDEAFRTAQKHAAGFGFRGKMAMMLHSIYMIRTKLIYRLLR